MGIEFQEENFAPQRFVPGGIPAQNKSGSKMVDFLIKQGIVKDASSANIVLIFAALLFLGLSIYFFIFGFNLPTFSQNSSEESQIEEIEQPPATELEM
jgi:hypothetical protein